MKVETQENGTARLVREHWSEWFMVKVAQGQQIPAGYGVAWLQRGDVALCLPLGINVLAGFGRRLYLGILTGVRPSAIERMLMTQRQVADREGYDRAVQDTQRQLEARFAKRIAFQPVTTGIGEDLDGVLTAEQKAEQLGDAAAMEIDVETWTDEERVFFMAAMELARRKGDAIFFACQDKRCEAQPVLVRVDSEGGFSLACFHKRRWLPDPKGPIPHVSRRGLAKLGIH